MDSRLNLPVGTRLDAGYRILRVVGSGGFGVTYEAQDVQLGTIVALKEYYPFGFGDRDASMSVRPKSDRHKQTFEWGRSSFLQEARTLARFEHPSIVRVMSVFEANATAYMVMRFERGQSLEDWLRGLGRPATQDELDRIAAPLLDALQMMHAENFLHRDIAPDNIIVRADGSPVLLDFGAARRAVAEMSRAITGVVKAGYSPNEQYSSDGRFQGPWSDIYAFGATLYRAVAGRPPEESALRVDTDRMRTAAQAASGVYRPGFLAAIDACLKVRHSERPQTIAQLRPMLLALSPSKTEAERVTPRSRPPSSRPPAARPQTRRVADAGRPVVGRWFAIAAAAVALLGGAYGGIEYARWQPAGTVAALADSARSSSEPGTRRVASAEIARRETQVDAAHAPGEPEAGRPDKSQAEPERPRGVDIARIAVEEEAARQTEAAASASKQEDERRRVAALTLNADERAAFVKRVQTVLKLGRCYDGAVSGSSVETQDSLDRFVAAAQKGNARPARIELAKATASDFETWLRDAGTVPVDVCAPKPKPPKPEQAKVPRPRNEEAEPPAQRQAAAKPPAKPAGEDRPGRGGNCTSWMWHNSSCTDGRGRRCTQTPGGRQCD